MSILVVAREILEWPVQTAKINCENNFEYQLATGGNDNLENVEFGTAEPFLDLEGTKLIAKVMPKFAFEGKHEVTYENGLGTKFRVVVNVDCSNAKFNVRGIIKKITTTGLITVEFYPNLMIAGR